MHISHNFAHIFTKSTVFRVQTSHFYVYCFNKSAYPYVKIPTVMSV